MIVRKEGFVFWRGNDIWWEYFFFIIIINFFQFEVLVVYYSDGEKRGLKQ